MDISFFSNIRNIPSEFRPMPFWSWNNTLSVSETIEQIQNMLNAGLGGGFMHARGGLKTEYMGKAWMDNIRCCLQSSKATGMHFWGYDENGWPSGFGNNYVNGLGKEYCQKALKYEYTDRPVKTENTITNYHIGDKWMHFYYEVNPFYVDLLDPKVTDAFLRSTHEKYAGDLGKDFSEMEGFFTDEPQMYRSGRPWSLLLKDEYRKRYNEELYEHLYEIFLDVDDFAATRVKYWSLLRDMFAENYFLRVSRWCALHGKKFTGHLICEENLDWQENPNSVAMPFYEYFDIPGVDWLRKSLPTALNSLQAVSVASQLGKKQVITESFAMCGWDVSFEDMRWIYESQTVRGISLLCQHLQAYSLEGIRKRDYPASISYQQPWWKYYKIFNDSVSRINMLISESSSHPEVLVLHPQSSVWITNTQTVWSTTELYLAPFEKVIDKLEQRGVQLHIGDERIIQRYGSIMGNRLLVGKGNYKAVVVPSVINISRFVFDILVEFVRNGGKLLWCGELPKYIDGVPCKDELHELQSNSFVCDIESLTDNLPQDILRVKFRELSGNSQGICTALRKLGDTEFIYIVNSSEDCKKIKLEIASSQAKQLDIKEGTFTKLNVEKENGKYYIFKEIQPRDSLVVFGDNTVSSQEQRVYKPLKNTFDGKWKIAESDDNLLTLDKCDCWFDGRLIGENMYVGDITEMANSLGKPVTIDLAFNFRVTEIPDAPVELIIEQPQKFSAELNGISVDMSTQGWRFDKAFKLVRLPALKEGENTLNLKTAFSQSEKVYQEIKNSLEFESQKNMLTYDNEIEAVYISGRFGVGCDTYYHNSGYDTADDFYITKFPQYAVNSSLINQGFPFFAGSIVLEKEIQSEEDFNCIKLEKPGAIVTSVGCNGGAEQDIVWKPYIAQTENGHRGTNTVNIKLTGSLRNMLGPHHLKCGECTDVGPWKFMHKSRIWLGNDDVNPEWEDAYSFTQFGFFPDMS